VITVRLSVLLASAASSVLLGGAPAFCQVSDSSDLQGQISHFADQLNQNRTEWNREHINETSDERLMRRLKQGGPRNTKLEGELSERIDREKFFQFEAQNNIHNLEAWVQYDQAREQNAVMNAQYQQHNAQEAAIDQEVARRNAYAGPAVASGSTLWGASPYSGGGYYGGGHWHSYGGGVRWHSSGGGGGGSSGGHSSPSHGGGHGHR
jgi:hypothetical protein